MLPLGSFRSDNTGKLFGYWVYKDSDTFYSTLDTFLADGTNARFKADLSYDDNGLIEVGPQPTAVLHYSPFPLSGSALFCRRRHRCCSWCCWVLVDVAGDDVIRSQLRPSGDA